MSPPLPPACPPPSLSPASGANLAPAIETSLNPSSSASPSRKKEDEEELTLSWGEKVFSKEEFRCHFPSTSHIVPSKDNSHIRQYANAKEEDFEAPMKKKLVCDAKKLLADGYVPKNK